MENIVYDLRNGNKPSMKSYKIYLTINVYKHNSSPKEEIPFKQFTFDNHTSNTVEINFNEDGTISDIIIDDHEENILIFDDYNSKSKSLTKYVHDAKGNLINEIEVDGNDIVLSETNYGYDDNNRMIHQEIKTDSELWSINFHLDKDGHQKSIEHFTNGKLTMREQIENFQNKQITYNIDENGKQRQKWLRLFDGNGNLSSVSEYDDHNSLVKIVSNYYDNYNNVYCTEIVEMKENNTSESYTNYKNKDEIISIADRYYENLELVLEKKYRYEYSEDEETFTKLR